VLESFLGGYFSSDSTTVVEQVVPQFLTRLLEELTDVAIVLLFSLIPSVVQVSCVQLLDFAEDLECFRQLFFVGRIVA
jgi:hypothetical protein